MNKKIKIKELQDTEKKLAALKKEIEGEEQQGRRSCPADDARIYPRGS